MDDVDLVFNYIENIFDKIYKTELYGKFFNAIDGIKYETSWVSEKSSVFGLNINIQLSININRSDLLHKAKLGILNLREIISYEENMIESGSFYGIKGISLKSKLSDEYHIAGISRCVTGHQVFNHQPTDETRVVRTVSIMGKLKIDHSALLNSDEFETEGGYESWMM